MKSSNITFILLLLCHLACNPSQESVKLSTKHYLLETPISRTNIEAIETSFQSKKLDVGNSRLSYQRIELPDRLPLTVNYVIKGDKVSRVRYTWGNMPKKKHLLDSLLVELIDLFEVRTNTLAQKELDYRRDEISTRIDFDDYYKWEETGQDYDVNIHYRDRQGAGATAVNLTMSL